MQAFEQAKQLNSELMFDKIEVRMCMSILAKLINKTICPRMIGIEFNHIQERIK